MMMMMTILMKITVINTSSDIVIDLSCWIYNDDIDYIDDDTGDYVVDTNDDDINITMIVDDSDDNDDTKADDSVLSSIVSNVLDILFPRLGNRKTPKDYRTKCCQWKCITKWLSTTHNINRTRGLVHRVRCIYYGYIFPHSIMV